MKSIYQKEVERITRDYFRKTIDGLIYVNKVIDGKQVFELLRLDEGSSLSLIAVSSYEESFPYHQNLIDESQVLNSVIELIRERLVMAYEFGPTPNTDILLINTDELIERVLGCYGMLPDNNPVLKNLIESYNKLLITRYGDATKKDLIEILRVNKAVPSNLVENLVKYGLVVKPVERAFIINNFPDILDMILM